MNTSIVISFTIAGILLLGILTFNQNVARNSVEQTFRMMTESNINTITEMIQHDFPKIGYDLNDMTDSLIVDADSTKIEFRANIDSAGAVETVVWHYTETPVEATDNPNDHILRRIAGNDTTDITLGVTDFNLKFYKKGKMDPMPWQVTNSEEDLVARVKFKVVCSSPQKINTQNSSYYIRSAWQKTYAPMNLRLIQD